MTIHPTLLLASAAFLAGTLDAQSTPALKIVPGMPPTLSVPASSPLPPSLTPIFRNLTEIYYPYNTSIGYGFSGKDTPLENEFWIAMPFTPATDATVYSVQAAVAWMGGANSSLISLNADAGGLPGAALETWPVTGLPKFVGSCCYVPAFYSTSGVAVTAGTQYWVVAGTTSANPTFNGSWYFAADAKQGVFAVNLNQTGWVQYTGTLGAFAVYGLGAPQ